MITAHYSLKAKINEGVTGDNEKLQKNDFARRSKNGSKEKGRCILRDKLGFISVYILILYSIVQS